MSPTAGAQTAGSTPETQPLPSGVSKGTASNANPPHALTPLEVENLKNLTADPEIDIEAPEASLPIGMKIDDRYEIVSVLGVGGFATVYRARHLTIDRDVALKVMDLKKGVDPSYAERFYREAKIAAKIHHNNVVAIY
ncbi:MAG: protein kinase, partial [Proteobacteria bacterium]|nr:protein kinase [Pseudomonadota bacterium]